MKVAARIDLGEGLTAKRDRKRQTPKGGRRLAHRTPLLKISSLAPSACASAVSGALTSENPFGSLLIANPVSRACRRHLSRVHPYRVGVQSEPDWSSPSYHSHIAESSYWNYGMYVRAIYNENPCVVAACRPPIPPLGSLFFLFVSKKAAVCARPAFERFSQTCLETNRHSSPLSLPATNLTERAFVYRVRVGERPWGVGGLELGSRIGTRELACRATAPIEL